MGRILLVLGFDCKTEFSTKVEVTAKQDKLLRQIVLDIWVCKARISLLG